jgi:hypothetical protein
MDTGQLLHVVVTLLIIGSAGAVAVHCDQLRATIERLRELNRELRVENEAEQRRTAAAIEQFERVQAEAGRLAAAPPQMLLPAPRETVEPAPARRRPVHRLESSAPKKTAVAALDASGPLPGATLTEARLLARGLMASLANQSPGPRERPDGPAAEPVPRQAAADRRVNWDQRPKRSWRTTIDVTPAPAGRPPVN